MADWSRRKVAGLLALKLVTFSALSFHLPSSCLLNSFPPPTKKSLKFFFKRKWWPFKTKIYLNTWRWFDQPKKKTREKRGVFYPSSFNPPPRSTSVPAEEIIDLIQRRSRTEQRNMKRSMKHEGYLLHKVGDLERWRGGRSTGLERWMICITVLYMIWTSRRKNKRRCSWSSYVFWFRDFLNSVELWFNYGTVPKIVILMLKFVVQWALFSCLEII